MKDYFLLWFLIGAFNYFGSLLCDWYILKLKTPWNVRTCLAAMLLGPIITPFAIKYIINELLYRRRHKNG